MLITEKINNCNIAYDNNFSHSVREYYLYCVELFKQQLIYVTDKVNVIFGDLEYNFNNDLPTKRVAFQYEHCLVKPGGRDSDGFPVGQIKLPDGSGNYLVRLCNYDLLSRSDVIVDYSLSNIINVETTDRYPHYNNRVMHISPSLYDMNFDSDRPLDVTTNFYDPNQPRRKQLLHNLPMARNYTGVYGADLARLYSQSKVLVNIHQTDFHHTLEELRVLPSLRRGCIIVAEKSALQGAVPYQDFITWADYKDIPNIVEDILSNYQTYRKNLFNSYLMSRLEDFEDENYRSVKQGLKWLLT